MQMQEVQEFLDDLGLTRRNQAMVDFIHNAYKYAETREPSGSESVREIAPMIDQENLTGKQAVKMLVLGMISRIEQITNDNGDDDDIGEVLRSLSDLAAVALYLRLTERADGAFLDEISGLVGKMALMLDAWLDEQGETGYIN